MMTEPKPTYHDHPFDEVSKRAQEVINRGATVYQKWTCAHCEERVTMTKPNVFNEEGIHEDCAVWPGGITNIKSRGCNFLAVFTSKLTPLGKVS